MRQHQRSKTAELVAAVRAAHYIHGESPKVFEDPFAADLVTNPLWLFMAKSRFLNWVAVHVAPKSYSPAMLSVLARARFNEDLLGKAVEGGMDQYVILGAGLDSFALRRRDMADKIKVYELDHPDSQAWKRERLGSLNIPLPDNLEFVPIDFEKTSIADALKASSYSFDKPAFFSWLGVIAYLTREAVFGTIDAIASFAPPGSELVLNYTASREFVDRRHREMRERLGKIVARMGEPFVSSWDPNTFPEEISKHGFEPLANISSKEQELMYFAGRGDYCGTNPGTYLAHFRLKEK